MEAKTKNHLKASNVAGLLAEAEKDVALKHTRSMRSFLKEFKRVRKVKHKAGKN